jgi:ketosteroid isomerase-like protein
MGRAETDADRTRQAFELWNARQFDRLLLYFYSDVIWDTTPMGAPGIDEYRGHDGMRRFFRDWLDAFPDATIEVEAVESRGSWSMATALQSVSGAASGVPVSFRYWGIGHWRDGRLLFVENHIDEALARAAFDRYTTSQDPAEAATAPTPS